MYPDDGQINRYELIAVNMYTGGQSFKTAAARLILVLRKSLVIIIQDTMSSNLKGQHAYLCHRTTTL